MDFLNQEQQKVSTRIRAQEIFLTSPTTEDRVFFPNGLLPLCQAHINGKALEFSWFRDQEGTYHLEIEGEFYTVELKSYYEAYFEKMRPKNVQPLGFVLKAPIPGRIVRIDVQEGDYVKKGQSLLVLSAMKLENVLSAPSEGKVKKIGVSLEETVTKNHFLLELE